MVRRYNGIDRKRLVRLSSLVLIICFFLNLNSGFLLQSAFAAKKRPQKSKVKRSSKKATPPAPAVAEESFLELVKEYIGTPYRWGGASKKGMDCSGFVKHVYSKTFSLNLPHSSRQQYALPSMKKVPKEDLKTGDLIFFSPRGKRINHVGIYLDNGNFIHAARKKGVSISSLDNRYWKLRMVCAKRPAGLWGYEGNNQGRSLTGVEIAMTDSGEMRHESPGDARGWLSMSEGLRPLSWWENPSATELSKGLTHTFGLQVSRSFGATSWSMSLLQESHFRYSSDRTDNFLISQPTYSMSERQYALDKHLQGVRMASDIHPLDWLQITPSFSYVGYENGLEDSPSWGPGLGLAIRIRPLPARWYFSADLQYWDESDRIGSGFNEIDNWKRSNLSLMFGYDLSNDLRLSIVGQHGMGNLFSVKENWAHDRQKQNGLFLGLDWAF